MPKKIISVALIAFVALILVGLLFLLWQGASNHRLTVNNQLRVGGDVANTNSPTPTLSSTAYLDEIAEPHLSATTAEALLAKVEDIDAYRSGSTAQLGGSDCGQSERHDQIVSLNTGSRRSFLANDGLLITATPNSFHWTLAGLRAVADDPTVVCGVGTTIPRAVVGTWVIWWSTCVSGTGPPQKTQPDYQSAVRCLQAQEALDQHYQWID